MRKIISFMHTSLDGFVAGPNGEMDWISIDEEMFGYAGRQTDKSDTALYGRVTYEMMDSYWPTAGSQPNATPHDIQHSEWYKKVEKIVWSRTMEGTTKPLTLFIGSHVIGEIEKIKQQPGEDIVIFGSPSVVHKLMQENLIDEFRLFINPVLLGKGIPMFKEMAQKVALRLIESRILASGVVMAAYKRIV